MKPVVLTTVSLFLLALTNILPARADEAFLPCPRDTYFNEEFVRSYRLAIESRASVKFEPSVRSTTRTHSNWMRRLSGAAFEWTWTHGLDQNSLEPGQIIEVEKAFFSERENGVSIAMVLDTRNSSGLETFTLDLITSAKMPLAWFEKRLKVSFLCKKID